MSAWIVAKEHVDYLLFVATSLYRKGALSNTDVRMGWFHNGTWFKLEAPDFNKIGQTLWHENHKSVNRRYSQDEETPEYRYAAPKIPFGFAQALKAIDCYCYQTCEHKEWEASEAYAFCEELRKRLTLAMIPYEEYDKAAWGIGKITHLPALALAQ